MTPLDTPEAIAEIRLVIRKVLRRLARWVDAWRPRLAEEARQHEIDKRRSAR